MPKKETKKKREKDWNELARAYALKNAVEHNGRAVSGAVISGLFSEGLDRKELSGLMPKINEIVDEVNNISIESQKSEFDSKQGEVGQRETRKEDELPEIPDVGKKGVVMRFAPAPSGFLHVGHVISNMISSLFVKKYGGKFYVRIEDTNPESIDPEAYKRIKEDCDWVFGNVAEYITQSDRVEIYYEYVEKLIDKDKVYVCTCEQEAFKLAIEKGIACNCRGLEKKETNERWKKMIDKNGYKPGEAVLRFKSSVTDPNPAMRDFPLARINTHKHPKQGTKYRVWPLMNLSVTIDDLEYGMTHVIRGKDHRDNAARQKMIYKSLGQEKKYPWVFFMGRIKFSDIDLSKRKIAAAIKEGKYESGEDVRLPTVASLRKRGYKPEAFAKFATQRGLTEVDKVMTQKDFFEILDRFNEETKKELKTKESK